MSHDPPPYDALCRERAELAAKLAAVDDRLAAALKAGPWPPLPAKVNVLICVLTYDNWTSGHILDYCCTVAGRQMHEHDRSAEIRVARAIGYPTDKVRNGVVKEAKAHGHHFVLMLDDDMWPDRFVGEAGVKPFLPSALDFALDHDGPCLVGAPYCGGPPAQQVMVMKYREQIPDAADPSEALWKMSKYTRDEAAVQTGFKRVAALPTGCLLVDLRVLDRLPPPWFSYEFSDPPYNTKLASTEDVVFTRNLDWLGVPSYCAWDSWAGHQKPFVTGRPKLAPLDGLPHSVWKAVQLGWKPTCDDAGAVGVRDEE